MQQSSQWLNQKPATAKLYTSYYGRLQKIDDSDSSDRIMLNQNDSVLSMLNPTYKAIMFDQFRKLGPTRDSEKESNLSNELFQMFKDGGGRFFKANYANHILSSFKCYEGNEKEALASELAFEEKIWNYFSVRELMIIISSVF